MPWLTLIAGLCRVSDNSSGPLQAFQFYIPFQHDVPAGTHLFFVPQVGLDCPQIDKDHMKLTCDFVWASAPYPISASRGVRPLAMLPCWCSVASGPMAWSTLDLFCASLCLPTCKSLMFLGRQAVVQQNCLHIFCRPAKQLCA